MRKLLNSLIIIFIFFWGCKINPLKKAVPLSEFDIIIPANRKVDPIFPHDIHLLTLNDLVANSKDIFSELKEPLVLSFWLTTCGPCLKELKEMTENYPEWNKETKFRFVAISTDFEKNKNKIKSIVKNNNYNFEVYWDFKREFRKIMPGELNGLPQVFIIGKNGEIKWHKKRFKKGETQLIYDQVKLIAQEF